MNVILPLHIRIDGENVLVRADLNWSILQLKQHLYIHANKKPEDLRILFAGAELPNTVILKNCNFAEETVVHVVATTVEDKNNDLPSQVFPVSHVAPNSSNLIDAACAPLSSKRDHFYVFCYHENCNGVKHGKLRVCCRACKDEAFQLLTGPSSWTDVLKAGQIRGKCNKSGCDQSIAEFFFKCVDAKGEVHRVTPLPLLRTNTKNIPCITCTGNEDIILVFPCRSSHVICANCFGTYCFTQLDCKKFQLVDEIGYTLGCLGMAGDCATSYIKDTHHFLIAGKEQYERYKNFATEEYLIQNGGLFCPGEGCGNGIFTDIETKRVVCHQSRGGCGMVFCRDCRRVFHDGECRSSLEERFQPPGPSNFNSIDEVAALQARWRDEQLSAETIEASSKPCPNCHCRIEKSGGCNHMTCSQCYFEWCWICVIPWGRNCESDHWFRAA